MITIYGNIAKFGEKNEHFRNRKLPKGNSILA